MLSADTTEDANEKILLLSPPGWIDRSSIMMLSSKYARELQLDHCQYCMSSVRLA
jgi:hypothetical protein